MGLRSLTRRSRFRQRLVAPEGILNEEETLEGLDLPCDLQLVLLPFAPRCARGFQNSWIHGDLGALN